MATLTINTTPADDARLVVAYGKILGLGRNATAQEIKAEIIRTIIINVRAAERQAAAEAAAAGVTPIEPT